MTGKSKKKVYFETFGCKVNYAETSRLIDEFAKIETLQSESLEDADILVINTCSVTKKADADARKAIRHALRKNPDLFVIVTGCTAEVNPEQFTHIEGVDIVMGNSAKFELMQISQNFQKLEEPLILEPENTGTVFEYAYSSEVDSRTRAVLKIQDGCEYKCTYCIIPQARGFFRSMPFNQILPALRDLESRGYLEAVLVGINLSEYNFEGKRFKDVLRMIAESDLEIRVRISSIEPNILDEEIIKIVKDSKNICHHFHIPLQSGSNRVLKSMQRRYLREHFMEKILMINREIPDASIGIDIITGFPGETSDNFQETIDLLQNFNFSYLHAFSYSERENTPAATMKNKVDEKVKKERTRKLIKLSNIAAEKFYLSQIGQVRDVIFEKEIEGSENSNYRRFIGHTDNYISVFVDSKNELIKSKMKIRLIKFINEKIYGEIFQP
ncbi:MAG: tRNA (N(6)-L-threonylcarbamoyladenosine(37)-C(2))-methylthiotransferase MtaB [Ignavibacteria bacterium GWF2_33_9]|nr:MAG: tRNA (N(6)-L-threonylcarbamoyladenosine(37)-C(2))-methylthiotransferase MtaB [Ignavibacteria bacterium GWF2_33_9]